MTSLLIAGAGGHGKVVADIARSQGWQSLAFVDDCVPEGKLVSGLPVVGCLTQADELIGQYTSAVVALGDNHLRMKWLSYFQQQGFQLPFLVHSSAQMGFGVKLGAGTVVAPGVVINAEASIGRGCIINSGAVVEHDCELADGVHISPGACLGGGACVEALAWIGMGAQILPNMTVQADAMVAAGAVVTKQVDAGRCVMGVPAQLREQS